MHPVNVFMQKGKQSMRCRLGLSMRSMIACGSYFHLLDWGLYQRARAQIRAIRNQVGQAVTLPFFPYIQALFCFRTLLSLGFKLHARE
jgi:hypothetical protein